MRRRIVIGIGIAVSALSLWLALRESDLASIRSSLSVANLYLAAPFLLFLFASYWLKCTRWKDLLSPVRNMRTRDLFPPIMIGYAGTAVLPLQMGEFIRAYVASTRHALPYALVLSSIAIERIFDLLTILALLGVVLATGNATPEILIKAGYIIAALAIFAFSFAFALVTNTEKMLSIFSLALNWLPTKISAQALDQLREASRGLESLTQPQLLLRIVFNSILQWSLMGICIWCSLIALDIQVPISAVILVLVATIVGISLPTSPGHVGTVQLAFVIALRPFGVTATDAIAASIFYHILAYLAVVLVGFAFVYKMGYGMFDIRARAQASATKTHQT